MADKMTIGFIGQGYVGKNYADSFEEQGMSVVRYSNERSYRENKAAIKDCDVVFIAVPTPTTVRGFDDSILREVLGVVGEGKIAVIKSTILPGTTAQLQSAYPKIYVLNCPEFLSEKQVRYDIDNPDANVIGMPVDTPEYRKKAAVVAELLPKVPTIICTSKEAELIKYAHNIHGFIEIIYANLLYDLADKLGANWDTVKEFMKHDRFMTDRYASPVHASGHSALPGRGAGGHCFIKDFAAFRQFYERTVTDEKGSKILASLEEKNIDLLVSSKKDLDLLCEVFGNINPTT